MVFNNGFIIQFFTIPSVSGKDVEVSFTLVMSFQTTTYKPSLSIGNCGYWPCLYVCEQLQSSITIRREMMNTKASTNPAEVYVICVGY